MRATAWPLGYTSSSVLLEQTELTVRYADEPEGTQMRK
jgi:hypothetical protein